MRPSRNASWLKVGIRPGSPFVGAHSHLPPLTRVVLLSCAFASVRTLNALAAVVFTDVQVDSLRRVRAPALSAALADSRAVRAPCYASSALRASLRMRRDSQRASFAVQVRSRLRKTAVFDAHARVFDGHDLHPSVSFAFVALLSA